MADPPSYPGTERPSDDTRARPPKAPTTQRRWVVITIWAAVAALLLLMIILHAAGVFGPGKMGM
jgi:hypothetical protein